MPDRSIRNSLSSLKLDIAVAALKSSFGYRKFAKKFNRCTAMSEEHNGIRALGRCFSREMITRQRK
ncbi:MAG: hypothetical protein WCB50_19795, partial [Pseudolabrys sp.]